METAIGFIIVIIAGFLQGTFVLPMTMAKNWAWENLWLTFSFLGMIILNWTLASLFIPHLFSVYRAIPGTDLLLLIIFGLGWGIGAVLFGIGMERLGMALGYPIIMGLIATLGSLIPMLIFHNREVLSLKGSMMLIGALIVIAGILVCSKAHILKSSSQSSSDSKSVTGIIIAIAAGILSCFPNVGVAYGGSTITAAQNAGASGFMAGNAVWALFFTMGFIPNALYTGYLIKKNKSIEKFRFSTLKNIFLGFFMSLMWIGSFYLYGISSSKLGNWGLIIGWPLFISLSIIVGNLWGIRRGEWKNAPSKAKVWMKIGLMVIFIAILTLGLCSLL